MHRIFDKIQYRPLWLYATVFVVFAVLNSLMFTNCLHAEDMSDTSRHSASTPSSPDIAGWAMFRNSIRGFEFRYPESLLKLTTSKRDVKIEHSVLFEHPDPCYFGDLIREPLSHVIDFSVSIRVTADGIASAMAHNTFLVAELPDVIEPGYLEGIKIGELLGYRIAHGTEGCGYYGYYFSVNRDTTLIVIRTYATKLNPITRDFQSYLQLPGIISPAEADKLFNQILSTFRWLH